MNDALTVQGTPASGADAENGIDCWPATWNNKHRVREAMDVLGVLFRALGPGPIDKAAQQHLFEFAVTYDAPALWPQLVAAGFRHARKAESGRAYIEDTHCAEYRPRRSPRIQDQLRAHGLGRHPGPP